MHRRLPLIVALFAAVSCGDKEKLGPEVQIRLPIQFVRLEPNTRSRLSYVDWTVETANGTFTGQVAVAGTAEALRFDFPGDEQPTRIELKGYDAENRLRAGGVVDAAALSAATTENPAKLWFHLYDEFQAYPDTPRGVFQTRAVYLDSSGRAVSLGGYDGVDATSRVVAFDPETGEESHIGDLLQRREEYGFTRLADGRFFLAGGSGDANASTSAEIWNPSTNASAAIFSSLSMSRTFRPTVFEAGGEVWVIGGYPLTTARAADILNGADFVASTPLFASPFGANYFWKQNGGVVEIRGWKGNQQTTGEVYRSDQTAAASTFNQVTTFHNAKVLEAGDQVLLWGAEDDAYQCDRIARIPKSGELTGGAIFTLEHTVCQPALVLLDADTMLVAGGYDGPGGAVRAVKHYEVPTNLVSQPATPDGREIELVHARNRPNVARRPDGTVIIVGGYGDPETTPRYEVLVPSP